MQTGGIEKLDMIMLDYPGPDADSHNRSLLISVWSTVTTKNKCSQHLTEVNAEAISCTFFLVLSLPHF